MVIIKNKYIAFALIVLSSTTQAMDLRRRGDNDESTNCHNALSIEDCTEDLPPLIKAIRENKVQIIKKLLKAAQNNHEISFKTEDGWHILHEAANYGELEIVELLLNEKFEPDLEGPDRVTPLQLAVLRGHEDVVRLLLERSAKIDHQNNFGTTVFHIAASEGYENLIHLFLKHPSFTPNILNLQTRENKQTCLHRAVEKGNSKILELLVAHGANIGIGDNEKHTILHQAAENSQENLIRTIITKCNFEQKHSPWPVSVVKNDEGKIDATATVSYLHSLDYNKQNQEIVYIVENLDLENQSCIYQYCTPNLQRIFLKANVARKILLLSAALKKGNYLTQKPYDKAQLKYHAKIEKLLNPAIVETNFKQQFEKQFNQLLNK